MGSLEVAVLRVTGSFGFLQFSLHMVGESAPGKWSTVEEAREGEGVGCSQEACSALSEIDRRAPGVGGLQEPEYPRAKVQAGFLEEVGF